MALIKCPECGRENVSDSAESCPSCGYNIKAHYAKLYKKENKNKHIAFGIGAVIFILVIIFVKNKLFNTNDADPFKKYYTDLGKDISEVNKSKYTRDSSLGFMDILVDDPVKVWDIDGKVMVLPDDNDKLGILTWTAEDVDLDDDQLDHIVEKMDELYGESEYDYDADEDIEEYDWYELSDKTIELFYYPYDEKIMIRFIKD